MQKKRKSSKLTTSSSNFPLKIGVGIADCSVKQIEKPHFFFLTFFSFLIFFFKFKTLNLSNFIFFLYNPLNTAPHFKIH